MGLIKIRNKLEEASQYRGRSGSQQSGSRKTSTDSTSRKTSTDSVTSCSAQQNNDTGPEPRPLTDAEMLERARLAHMKIDFEALAKGPNQDGDWQRVEASDQFVVFRGKASTNTKYTENGVEVMCTGQLEACLEEVASILRSNSEVEHNTAMTGLYDKHFIFGSFEREVACAENQDEDDSNVDSSDHLAVKTKSFLRTKVLGRNEQWCYFDYYQRKEDNAGFMISKRALHPMETTPGRIVVANAKVDQLHGLNASYLVDRLPDQKGLRVVYHAWFDQPKADRKGSRRKSVESTASTIPDAKARSSSFDYGDTMSHKAQLRRLLSLAHGVTKLPELIRRRRFGVQVPAGNVHVQNTRCPCCTHTLAPVKLSLAMFKKDSRRCFLCGYLVCVDCWRAEKMESMNGRVAAIVACTRCRANVEACEYSEVFAGTAEQREKHRGPARVVGDSNSKPTISLLVDFLSTSLLNAAAGSAEHAAAMAVIRTLLRQAQDDSDESGDDTDTDGDDEDNEDDDAAQRTATRFKILGELLSSDERLPSLDDCKLGNTHERNYELEFPDDATTGVPRSPTPNDEEARIAAAKTNGLLQLADVLAPPAEDPPRELTVPKPDTHDLRLLCHLAVKTLGCAYSFVTIMCSKHEHVLAGTHPDFVGAAVPREQTTCQHALMTPHPFMVAHHEADVRFHNHAATSHIPIRFYVGFPMQVDNLTVGMICCVDTKPRNEITRTQYGTMKRLASTALHFLLQKSRQLQLEVQQQEEQQKLLSSS